MWGRIQRRSERLFILESRKAAGTNKKNEENRGRSEETSTSRGTKRKAGRMRETRPVQDLDGTWSGLQYKANAAGASCEIPLPDKETLVLILDTLKQNDSYDIFAKPVDPNEVKDYYEIIEEPMDFSTIAKKIDEQSYKTLNEFEHDLYLVYNNAMYFNAPSTIYYKQAVGIRNLVERLLYVLVTDPKNLISECGKETAITVEKKKDVAECSEARDKTTGRSNEPESENLLPSRCSTCTPHTSFGNESLRSQVLKSSKKLEVENTFKYSESLMRFAKDLGPTAQTVAMRKIVEGVAETSKHQISASSSRLHELNTESDPTKFSFVNLLPDDANGFDLTDEVVSSGSKKQKLVPAAYSCPSSSWQWPFQSMTEGSSRGEPPVGFMREGNSHHLGGAHPQAVADGEGHKIGGNIEEGGLVWDWSKLNVSEGSSSCQAFGSVQGLASQYPGGFHQIQASTDQLGIIHGGNVQQGDQVSNWFKPVGLRVHEAGSSHSGTVNHGKQIFNWMKPMELGLEPIPDAAGPSHGSCIKHGEQISSWFKPTELGLEPIPDAGPNHAGNIGDGGQIFDEFKATDWGLELMPDAAGPNYAGNFNHGGQGCNSFKPSELGPEFIPDTASPNHAGNINPGGLSSVSFKPTELGLELIAAAVGPKHAGSVTHEVQISNSFKLNETGLEHNPHAAGPNNAGCSSKHGGERSNWFKPTESGTEQNTDDWLQEQCEHLVGLNMSSQAEPLSMQGWTIIPYDEKPMNTPYPY